MGDSDDWRCRGLDASTIKIRARMLKLGEVVTTPLFEVNAHTPLSEFFPEIYSLLGLSSAERSNSSLIVRAVVGGDTIGRRFLDGETTPSQRGLVDGSEVVVSSRGSLWVRSESEPSMTIHGTVGQATAGCARSSSNAHIPRLAAAARQVRDDEENENEAGSHRDRGVGRDESQRSDALCADGGSRQRRRRGRLFRYASDPNWTLPVPSDHARPNQRTLMSFDARSGPVFGAIAEEEGDAEISGPREEKEEGGQGGVRRQKQQERQLRLLQERMRSSDGTGAAAAAVTTAHDASRAQSACPANRSLKTANSLPRVPSFSRAPVVAGTAAGSSSSKAHAARITMEPISSEGFPGAPACDLGPAGGEKDRFRRVRRRVRVSGYGDENTDSGRTGMGGGKGKEYGGAEGGSFDDIHDKGGRVSDQALEFALQCPITHVRMTDPTIASDGHTYERSAILKWFEIGDGLSPITREVLESEILIPNHALRALCHNAS